MADDANRPASPPWLNIRGSKNAPQPRARTTQRVADARAAKSKAPPRRRAQERNDAAALVLAGNARVVLERRYLAKDADGNLTETPEELFRRVARTIAAIEANYGDAGTAQARVADAESRFFDLMASMRFLPNSPTLGNAGRPLQQLSACFVLPVEDSMLGIFDSLKNTALIHQSGGGTGFAFSRLRAAGDRVASTGGVASGPVSFMRVFDAATESIKQGGTRRGANMAILSIDHPDIETFINVKSDMTALQNFNISVAVTERFMQAVERDETYDLVNPRTKKKAGKRHARDIFRQLIANAWRNGDPGVVFLDRINHDNPTPRLGMIEATNPCVTGDTRIATSRGLVRADELHATQEPLDVIADARGEHLNALGVSLRPATPMFQTSPKAPVYRLTTTHGYELRATAWHEFVTPRGRVPLRDLRPGDTLLVQSGEGAFGALGSRDLGIVIGMLMGDGNFHRQRGVVVSLWGDDRAHAGVIGAAIDRVLASHAADGRVATAVRPTRADARLRLDFRSVALARVLASYGVTPPDKMHIPEIVWQGTRGTVAGFLAALFACDGTVSLSQAKGSCSVRLAQSNLAFLRDVQMLLANFGIVAKIKLRRVAGERSMPDGRGGMRMYAHRAQYELIIDGESRDRFAGEIGFLFPEKQAKLLGFIGAKKRRSNRSVFETAVATIAPDGEEAVYDTSEPATHTITANGIVTGQCGEQPLLPYESCNLGSLNLAALMRDAAPAHKRARRNGTPPAPAEFDWDALAEAIPQCARFLDDVIDANRYPIAEIDDMTKRTRKIGLGVMGWADVLFRLRIPYDSEEAIALAGRVMSFIQEHADRASVALAEERGVFPAWHGSIYDTASGDPRGGPRYRNATRTTVAPTGTLSIIADCSGGIEPAFALAFMRQHFLDRDDPAKPTRLPEVNKTFRAVAQESGFYSDELMNYLADGGRLADRDDVPDWAKHVFVTSHDIAPEWHVRMQAAFQRHTDNAVSKTINFRSEATVADVEQAYMLAYREGCKGITVYRDGSRDHQVLSHATARGPEQAESIAAEIAMGFADLIPSGAAHPEPLSSTLPRPSGTPYRRHLPDERRSITHKFRVGEQEGYVTVGLYDEGQPGEIFVNISKEGSTIRGLMDSVAVLTSVALQYGVPLANLVSKFRGVHFEPAGLTGNPQVPVASSLVDYIFRWLELRFLRDDDATGAAPALPAPSKPKRSRTPAAKAETATRAKKPARARKPAASAPPEPGSATPDARPARRTSIPPQYAAAGMSTGLGCPECGAILYFAEGCLTCRSCGYTKCG